MKHISKYGFYALLATICFAVSSCIVKGSNEPYEETTKSLSPDSFTRIHLSGVDDITFTQGDSTTVVFTGDKKKIESYSIETDNGCLTIKSTKKINISKHPVHIHITSPSVEEISINGAGNFYLKDMLKTEKLDLSLGGAGSLNIEKIECGDLKVKVGGAGDVDLDAVTAQHVSLSMSGVGNVKAVFVNSGDAEVSFEGVGDVTLSGNVKSLNKNSSGTGNINTKNLKIE